MKAISKSKSEKLNIRLKPSEKRKLTESAEENNMSVSDYVRKQLFHPDKKQFTVTTSNKVVYLLVKLQEVCNYISEKYSGDNSKLEGMLEEIWEHMND